MIAAINMANTMAKPASEPTWRISSHWQQRDDAEGNGTGRGQNARKLKVPDQTTATCAGSERV